MENKKIISDGVWATMLTPYTKDGEIDYNAAEALVEWYIANGISGIFAICQSSEMFFLTEREKEDLLKFIVKVNKGRIGIIASGMTQKCIDDQIEYAKKIAEIGVDAVVLLRNMLGADFKTNIEKITEALSEDVALGLYECPFPNKVCLSDDELRVLAESGRFSFLKDTCVDFEIMKRRIEIVKGSGLKLFNANEATLYESIKLGYNGYSGIMANYHPDLYVWLCDNLNNEKAPAFERYLTMMSWVEARDYPISAKKYLCKYEGIPMTPFVRSVKSANKPCLDFELDAFRFCTEHARRFINGSSIIDV